MKLAYHAELQFAKSEMVSQGYAFANQDLSEHGIPDANEKVECIFLSQFVQSNRDVYSVLPGLIAAGRALRNKNGKLVEQIACCRETETLN